MMCNASRMDMQTGTVPRWDLADRLRKSLREADMGIVEMADYLEVHRNTVSNWVSGRTRPPAMALRQWAQRTGVSYFWLRKGELDTPTAGGAVLGFPDRQGQLRK